MSVTEEDESKQCCESPSNDPRDTGNNANTASYTNLQIINTDKDSTALQSDRLPRDSDENTRTVPNRGLTHLDLAADSGPVSTEPSSGFMLISVKHLSKVRRANYRTRSACSLSSRTAVECQKMNDVNTIESSSRDDSSPTTSSPMCEEESLHDFHGSGSIEAEEFEDDDEADEEEGTNEDDSTTVVVSTSGKLSKVVNGENPLGSLRDRQVFQINRSSQVCSSTQTASRPETPLGNRDAHDSNFMLASHFRLSPKVPQTLPSGFSLPTCDRHFELFGHHPQDPHYTINPCEVFRYNSVVPSRGTASLLPSLFAPHIQTNSSHYQSELGARSPTQNPVQTAPVSGSVSPPPITTIQSTTDIHPIQIPLESTHRFPPQHYPSTTSMLYDPSPSLGVVVDGMVMAVDCMGSGGSVDPVAVQNWSNHQQGGVVRSPMIRSPFNLPIPSSSNTQQHHTYATGLPITCPLHPHSASASDVRSSQMIAKTESNPLADEVAAINTASLPSLQPASRFRKARIHETVEQWSHGRISVHDCHLKVVPDWVSDLQKKVPVLDQDITTALAQRVNCFSCLEQKALDRSGLHQSLGISSLKGIGDSNPHPPLLHSKGAVDDSQQMRRLFNRTAMRNNLFSFWDGGARVFCRLPKSTRLCVPSVSEAPAQPEENNLVYAEKTLTAGEDSSDMHSKPADSCAKVAADSTCCLQDEAKNDGGGGGSGPPMLDNPSPAPAIFLPTNNADPATAYLRRQVATEGQLSYLSTQQDSLLKTGDSPSADELSLPLSDVAQSSPGSVDYTNQSLRREVPAFQLTRPVVVQQYSGSDTSNGTGQDSQTFIVRKRPVPDAMSVVVPPTSPTLFVEGGSGEPCPSGLTNDKQSPGPVVNGIVGHGEPLMVVHHPKFPRLMNGEYAYKIPTGGYHNVIPTFANGPSADPRSSSALPSPTSSLRSSVPIQNCPDTTTAAAAAAAAAVLLGDTVKPVPSSINGGETAGLHQMSSLPPHTADQSIPPRSGSKGMANRSPCITGSLPTIPPTKVMLNNGLERDYVREGKLSALLSNRLETRINENIDSIRAAIVNTVRDELLCAYTEAADLLSEVDRLKEEVTRLRGYQAAFYALRPFVSAELWEHLNSQQMRLQLQQPAPPVLPMNSSTSGSSVPTTCAAPSSMRSNSPQRVD